MKIEEKINLIVKKYKLKKIELNQIYKYFPEYNELSMIFEITEGYIKDEEGLSGYVRDALSDNNLLVIDERRYDLYMLRIEGKMLASTF